MQIKFLDSRLEEFIKTLEKQTIAKVLRTVDMLERFGHQLGMPHSRRIADRLYELRIRGAQEVRIFYTLHKGTATLLHGFVKKSQQTPRKEIDIAHNRRTALDRL